MSASCINQRSNSCFSVSALKIRSGVALMNRSFVTVFVAILTLSFSYILLAICKFSLSLLLPHFSHTGTRTEERSQADNCHDNCSCKPNREEGSAHPNLQTVRSDWDELTPLSVRTA